MTVSPPPTPPVRPLPRRSETPIPSRPTLVDPNSRLSNYTVTNNTAVFTVTNGAVLTVTAANIFRVYGAANPALTASYIGQQGSDTFTATATTNAIATSPVLAGGYTIVPAVTANAGASLSNYTVALVNGTFTITQAATSVTLRQTAPTTVGVGTGGRHHLHRHPPRCQPRQHRYTHRQRAVLRQRHIPRHSTA